MLTVAERTKKYTEVFGEETRSLFTRAYNLSVDMPCLSLLGVASLGKARSFSAESRWVASCHGKCHNHVML